MNTPRTASGPAASAPQARVGADELDRFCRGVLQAAGADAATVDAAARAMMHGSRLGIDTHGVRLLHHYVTVLREGRVNPRPKMTVDRALGAVASLDADDGHGALAAFTAIDHAAMLAGRFGIGAVAIRNGSHFGPAGAFTLPAAEAGLIGLAMCNADSIVRLHDGAVRFHGTNPIACAVPVSGGRPWLLDMATSAIPYNRVELYKSVDRELPPGTASSSDGLETVDPDRAAMLAPLGGGFGYKGAGLSGLVEILSAVLSGMRLSVELLPMAGPDLSTPRGLGAFVVAIDPGAFAGTAAFDDGMRRYLAALRRSAARPGAVVHAPGDLEWAEAERRRRIGVPIDPATRDAFERLSQRFAVAAPAWGEAA